MLNNIFNIHKKIWIRFLGYPEKYQKSIDGFRMNLNLRDKGISQALYYQGGRERAFMSILKRTVKPGMTCLDIGANIGYTTLNMLGCTGPEGYVYAVEPDPHNLELLEANISANGFNKNCEIIEGVVSDQTKEIDFWLADRPNISSVEKTERSISKIRVRAFDFSELMSERKFPEFIKMDVEGHEVRIFQSAYKYFIKNLGPTNILVEVHPSFYSQSNDFAAILKKFFRLGFSARYIISTPFAQPKPFREAGYEPEEIVETDGYQRGIYQGIAEEDVIRLACYEQKEGISNKIVRAMLISRD